MSYRFVKITNYYKTFLQAYYSKNSFIKEKSYSEQFQHLMSQLFGWSDYFIKHLSTVNVEAFEIVANAIPLQNTWQIENSISTTGFQLLFQQLKSIKPNVVFFQDSLFITPSFIKYIRTEIPSIKLIVGWCCSPYTKEHLDNYKLFDIIFVCSPEFYKDLSKVNPNVFQVYHGFEDSIHQQINSNNNPKLTDFIFTGSLITGSGFHKKRVELLKNLCNENINITMNVNNQLDSLPIYFLKSGGYILSKILSNIGLNNIVENNIPLRKISKLSGFPSWINIPSNMKNKFDSPIFGREMFQAISNSKICFNSHGEIAGDYACNIRLFEATGMGSLLFTDHKKNISELFDVDNEVITYNNFEECVEKVKWLLNHPADIERISIAGQSRTLKSHRLKDRVLQMNEIILDKLKNK